MHEFLLLLDISLVILVPFEILPHHPKTDILIGIKKTFSGSYIMFSEKRLWFKWLRHFLALFYLSFGFCLFMLLFIVTDLL